MPVSFDGISVGDEIEVSHRGVVTLRSRLSGGAVRLGDDTLWLYADDASDVRVVKKARVPFVVGEELTPEMGEPPVGSVIVCGSGYTAARSGYNAEKPWVATGQYLYQNAFKWEDVYVLWSTTLVYLGSGSES